MGKYDGINIAEVTLINNRVKQTSAKREKISGLSAFMIKLAVAALIAVVAFIGKWIQTPVTESVSGLVVKAILYDMSFSENDEPGGGVLAAFFDLGSGKPA